MRKDPLRRALVGFVLGLICSAGLTACLHPVSEKGPAAEPDPSQTVAGAILKRGCLGCHVAKTLFRYKKTPAQWARTISRMRTMGAEISDDEMTVLRDYLSAKSGSP